MAGSTFEPQACSRVPPVPSKAAPAAAESAPKRRTTMQMIPKLSINDEPQWSHVLYDLGMTIG